MKVPALFLAACAAMLLTAPAMRAAELPGGRRALNLQLDGRWIGNGVSFSPYRDGQTPDGPLPTDAEILADLQLVARYWNLIRMYDVVLAEPTVRLIHEHKLPLRLVLGAWIAPNDAAHQPRNRAEVATAVRLANAYPDVVIAVAVGNEPCVEWSDHRCDPADVARWAREVRAQIKQPVTCADDYNFWNKPASQAVAAELDFIILHGYALWNGRPLDGAMAWLGEQYDNTVRLHPGIPVIIGESGWATSHDASRTKSGEEGALMKAETSVAAQENYLRQHYRWLNERHVATFLFEAFDESWKGGGEKSPAHVAEKHWGVFDAQRKPKASFQAIQREFYGEK